MGANTSSTGESDVDRDRILKNVGSHFSNDEGQAIKRLFIAISGSPERTVYQQSNIQVYFESAKVKLSTGCVNGLFHALLGNDKDTSKQYTQNGDFRQSFPSFVQHSSSILKGSLQDKADRLFIFCSRGSTLSKNLLLTSLEDVVMVACESEFIQEVYPHLIKFASNSLSRQRLALFLLESLQADSGDDFEVEPSLFEEWFSKTELAQKVFQLAFSCTFYQEAASVSPSVISDLQEVAKTNSPALLVPLKITHPLIRETFSSQLLDHSSLILLSHYIPMEFRGKLYPLFSSFHHGESYSMFCKQLIAPQGPTLIVIKDTDGHVFGAFAAENWQFGPKFRGNANCFLFTLAPTMGVFLPSGYNKNYMYLQQNAQTLPNGLGMGGQMEYFGLWLSADYGHGHSKAKPKCSTYNSPRLSKDEEFNVQLLEVWGVGDPVLPEEEDKEPSILDKDATAAQLLEMAGKKLYSKDIRQAPDEN